MNSPKPLRKTPPALPLILGQQTGERQGEPVKANASHGHRGKSESKQQHVQLRVYATTSPRLLSLQCEGTLMWARCGLPRGCGSDLPRNPSGTEQGVPQAPNWKCRDGVQTSVSTAVGWPTPRVRSPCPIPSLGPEPPGAGPSSFLSPRARRAM